MRAGYLYILVIILVLNACNQPASTEDRPPNILLIITDDQGYGDLGFHGNPHIKTPTIDQLARESTRFTQFYVSPVCAPTRSSLMTGRYSLRTGVWDTYNGGAIMATEEQTLAEYLKAAGYTTGLFGKWHLGDSYPFRAIDQGFDEVVRHEAGGIGQVSNIYNYFRYDSSYFDPVLLHNGKYEKYEGYCSDIFTREALHFIEESRERPFFTYLAYNAPHTPLQLPPEYQRMYADVSLQPLTTEEAGYPLNHIDDRAARRVYGMVSNIDDNLQLVFEKLKELDLYDDTIIIFMTDNGPQQPRYNAGLRGRKGSVYEGGTRVPFFIRYPAVFQADREIRTPAAHLDVLPTLLDIAGLEVPQNIDGRSMLPLLAGDDASFSDRALFSYWQRGFPEQYRNVSIRKGDFKVVGRTGYPGEKPFELFNLASDPYELNDLKDSHPDVLDSLKTEFDQWFEEIIASPNLEPRRIVIGSEHENPVILNRNDARGEPGIWAQDHIYGYWALSSLAGNYDITLHFRDTLRSPGYLTFRFDRTQQTLYNRDTLTKELKLTGIKLNEADDELEAWYWTKGQPVMPFYVTVERTDGE